MVQGSLVMDPSGRMTCEELLDHSYFDSFRDWFKPELELLLAKDAKKVAKSKSRMHGSVVRDSIIEENRLVHHNNNYFAHRIGVPGLFLLGT